MISSFWSMLRELESVADNAGCDVVLRHHVKCYYKQWNRITGDDKRPIWETRNL